MITFLEIILGLFLLFLIYASANIRSGVYVKTFSRLPTKDKTIALTFDDGPHPEITPLILAILKKYNVEATFFCIGENIEKNRALAHKIVENGHLIGNHTNKHSFMFPFYSSERMKMEIDACRNQINSVNPSGSPLLFRPPFGVTNPALKKALKNSGYKVIGWSIRSLDTIIKNSVLIVQRVIIRIRPGSILLFHDSQTYTPEIIERVIIFALKKGYTFVRIDKCL